MKKHALLFLVAEFLWIFCITVAAAVTVLPILNIIAQKFLLQNFILALLFFFFFRIVIFFRSIAFLRPLVVKIILFAVNIILFIAIMNKMQEMFYILDTYDLSIFLAPNPRISGDEVLSCFNFFKNEFILFSVGTLILIPFIELRILFIFFEIIKKIK